MMTIQLLFIRHIYRTAIGNFAASKGYFGGKFSFGRMIRIKLNFLWMMYLSGWVKKLGKR
ncbi:DUF4291 family protein [Nostoc sp.]|uniref:DUF4291 family protein n=1 Tax=Nostoc sp. TaxID=1180 RepID=UPI002FF9ED85